MLSVGTIHFNPLTTDDTFWCCLTLTACYQLAQSILKIGSALAERVGQGEVGGCTVVKKLKIGMLLCAEVKGGIGGGWWN